MRVGRLYIVEWEDARGCSTNWVYPEDLPKKLKPYIVHSVGLLLKRSKRAILLAPHYHGEGGEVSHYVGDMQIPRSAIRRVRRIRF